MEGIITSFRGPPKHKSPNQMIIEIEGVDNIEKAEKLVGKTVVWKSPGAKDVKITGKISFAHGRNGKIRAIFERGMPGQSLGTKVKIE